MLKFYRAVLEIHGLQLESSQGEPPIARLFCTVFAAARSASQRDEAILKQGRAFGSKSPFGALSNQTGQVLMRIDKTRSVNVLAYLCGRYISGVSPGSSFYRA
jgi:hypothetical protein